MKNFRLQTSWQIIARTLLLLSLGCCGAFAGLFAALGCGGASQPYMVKLCQDCVGYAYGEVGYRIDQIATCALGCSRMEYHIEDGTASLHCSYACDNDIGLAGEFEDSLPIEETSNLNMEMFCNMDAVAEACAVQ